MTETTFFQSWAFIFLVGVGCFIVGLILAMIFAASGRASRMEEKMEADMYLSIHDANKKEKKKRGGPEIEIATQGKPEDV